MYFVFDCKERETERDHNIETVLYTLVQLSHILVFFKIQFGDFFFSCVLFCYFHISSSDSGGWKIGQSSHVKILLKNVTEAHTRRFAEHEMRFSSARDEAVSTALCRASFFGVGPRNESGFDGEQSSSSSSSAERDRLTKEWLRRFHEVFKSRQREISELAASLRQQAAENRYEDAREERKNEPRTFEKDIHSKSATVTSRIVESLEQYFSTTVFVQS